jgi:hypothetical protein
MPDHHGQRKNAAPVGVETFDSSYTVQGQAQTTASSVQADETQKRVGQRQFTRIHLIFLLGLIDRL